MTYKIQLWAHEHYVEWSLITAKSINTLRPRQNGRHFPDDIFKPIFVNENVRISIMISLKFVPKIPINNITALVQIMAWRRPGDMPLSEPMMVCLLTHICVTRPRVNNNVWIIPKGPINNITALVQIIAWCWTGDKPLSEPMVASLLTHICITQLNLNTVKSLI